MKPITTIILFLSALTSIAQNQDFQCQSRHSYYTYEPIAEAMIKVATPTDELIWVKVYKDNQEIGNEKQIANKPILNIPFQINSLANGTHQLRCEIKTNAGTRSYDFQMTKLASKPHTVKIDYQSGGLIVDGLPYFPFGFYCYSPVQPTLAEEELAKGFNMMSPYQKIKSSNRAERKRYMDRCAELGMKVHYNLLSVAGGGGVGSGRGDYSEAERMRLLEEEVLAFKDHPALLAWYISDEPVGQGVAADQIYKAYQKIKMLDPYHPATIVFMTPRKAQDFAHTMDIVMCDPYPVPNHPIDEVSIETKELKDKFEFKKPVWIVPQAFGGAEHWGREPTDRELRAMTYSAIVSGATGIQYFIRHGYNSFPKSTTAWAQCGAIAMEVQELTPYLLSGKQMPTVAVSDNDILAKAYQHKNKVVIVAVNENTQPKNISLSVSGIGSTNKVKVLFEDRALDIKAGKITDIIEGFGRRVYKIDLGPTDNIAEQHEANLVRDPSFEDSPMPGIPSACYAKLGSDKGASYILDTRQQIHGEHSLRLHTPQAMTGFNLNFFPIIMTPNKSYVVSIWARAKSGNPEFEIGVKGYESKTFRLSNQWKKYSFGLQSKKDLLKTNLNLKLQGRGTAWFDLLQVIEDPIITYQSNIFAKSTTVQIESGEDAVIYYTTNGKEPDKRSTRYTQPFSINETSTLKVKVFDGRKVKASSERHIQLNARRVTAANYTTMYSSKYAANGNNALIDGQRGSNDFRTGNWQGFEAKDLEVVFDMGTVDEIEKVTIGFLQDPQNWIYFPKEVTISTSKKGKRFKKIKTVNLKTGSYGSGARIKEVLEKINRKGRYIKIEAANIGQLPTDHPSKGAAWIFVDEVIVE